jgi:hypothetical protein
MNKEKQLAVLDFETWKFRCTSARTILLDTESTHLKGFTIGIRIELEEGSL